MGFVTLFTLSHSGLRPSCEQCNLSPKCQGQCYAPDVSILIGDNSTESQS